jgi:uncharacterized protein YneR
MSKSVAILTIGSLFWGDDEPRPAWRRERLAVDRATRVRVPIRYGRKTTKSGYTMVLSTELPTEQFGVALAVPCRAAVDTFEQLNNEAEALWVAETNGRSAGQRVTSSWGAVGLLANPNCSGLDSLVADWSARISSERDTYMEFPCLSSAVAASGLLRIPWPVTESGDSFDCDFILATPTEPTPKSGPYATPPQIAASYREAKRGRRYFDKTRGAGISTAFDDDILKCLESG